MNMFKKIALVSVVLTSVSLAGCITDIVTVPLGLAYDVTKVAVKGTAAVVGGTVSLLTPDGKKKDDDSKKDNKDDSKN
jgi:hypothetical protein